MDDPRPGEIERRQADLGPRRFRYLATLAALGLWCAFCIGWALSSFDEATMHKALAAMLAGCLVLILVHYFDWRCPACKQYLSCGQGAKFCPECGARLS